MKRPPLTWDGEFESGSLRERVRELSVPLALDLILQGLKVSRGAPCSRMVATARLKFVARTPS